jgi:hypothetical protein
LYEGTANSLGGTSKAGFDYYELSFEPARPSAFKFNDELITQSQAGRTSDVRIDMISEQVVYKIVLTRDSLGGTESTLVSSQQRADWDLSASPSVMFWDSQKYQVFAVLSGKAGEINKATLRQRIWKTSKTQLLRFRFTYTCSVSLPNSSATGPSFQVALQSVLVDQYNPSETYVLYTSPNMTGPYSSEALERSSNPVLVDQNLTATGVFLKADKEYVIVVTFRNNQGGMYLHRDLDLRLYWQGGALNNSAVPAIYGAVYTGSLALPDWSLVSSFTFALGLRTTIVLPNRANARYLRITATTDPAVADPFALPSAQSDFSEPTGYEPTFEDVEVFQCANVTAAPTQSPTLYPSIGPTAYPSLPPTRVPTYDCGSNGVLWTFQLKGASYTQPQWATVSWWGTHTDTFSVSSVASGSPQDPAHVPGYCLAAKLVQAQLVVELLSLSLPILALGCGDQPIAITSLSSKCGPGPEDLTTSAWTSVYIHFASSVSQLDGPTLTQVRVALTSLLANASVAPVTAVLSGSVVLRASFESSPIGLAIVQQLLGDWKAGIIKVLSGMEVIAMTLVAPTKAPTIAPTPSPTPAPSAAPTWSPSIFPTYQPTLAPSYAPTRKPTGMLPSPVVYPILQCPAAGSSHLRCVALPFRPVPLIGRAAPISCRISLLQLARRLCHRAQCHSKQAQPTGPRQARRRLL